MRSVRHMYNVSFNEESYHMSYSFNVRAATKQEVLEKVVESLEKIVSQQPIHTKDREQAQKVAEAFVAILPDDDTKDVYVALSGSLSWNGTGTPGDEIISSANVSVAASLLTKEAT